MINADFESILIPEKNEKQNPAEFYLNKCQNRVGCSLVTNQYVLMIILVSLLYLVQCAVHKLITSMSRESRYCSGMMKKKNL